MKKKENENEKVLGSTNENITVSEDEIGAIDESVNTAEDEVVSTAEPSADADTAPANNASVVEQKKKVDEAYTGNSHKVSASETINNSQTQRRSEVRFDQDLVNAVNAAAEKEAKAKEDLAYRLFNKSLADIREKESDTNRRLKRHELVEAARVLMDIGSAAAGGGVWKRDVKYDKYDKERETQQKNYINALNKLYDNLGKAGEIRSNAALKALQLGKVTDTVTNTTGEKSSASASNGDHFASGGGRGSSSVSTVNFDYKGKDGKPYIIQYTGKNTDYTKNVKHIMAVATDNPTIISMAVKILKNLYPNDASEIDEAYAKKLMAEHSGKKSDEPGELAQTLFEKLLYGSYSFREIAYKNGFRKDTNEK